jgi:hypothetical protein
MHIRTDAVPRQYTSPAPVENRVLTSGCTASFLWLKHGFHTKASLEEGAEDFLPSVGDHQPVCAVDYFGLFFLHSRLQRSRVEEGELKGHYPHRNGEKRQDCVFSIFYHGYALSLTLTMLGPLCWAGCSEGSAARAARRLKKIKRWNLAKANYEQREVLTLLAFTIAYQSVFENACISQIYYILCFSSDVHSTTEKGCISSRIESRKLEFSRVAGHVPLFFQ